ncbi:MAG: YihY/virulence factor BrkB family protein [Acidimicrobiia bacterium]
MVSRLRERYAGRSQPEPIGRDAPWHRRALALIKAAGQEWANDKASRLAASLTYYAIFSLAPLLVLAVAVAGFVFGRVDARQAILGQAEVAAGEAIADALADIMDSASESRRTATVVSIALVFFGASTVFLQLQGALNIIFRAPEQRVRGVVAAVRQRVKAFLAALAIGVVLLTLLAANAALSFVDDFVPRQLEWLAELSRFAGPLVSFGLLVLVFGMMLQYLTVARVPWRAARWGAALTGVLFVVGAVVLGTYLSSSAVGSAYGPASVLIVLLAFTYYQAQIMLFGAEFTKVYADYLGHGVVAPPGARPAAPGHAGATPVSTATRSRPEVATQVGPAAVWAFLAGLALGWWKGRKP